MDEIDEVLTRGVETLLPDKEGLKKLMQEKQITLYQGFDPSMPSLHLGHLVGVMKLRQFQKLGHRVIFLIGDFTGMIGDPSDKFSVRRSLSRDEVLENSKTWKDQIKNLIDFEGENKAEIMYNSRWNDSLTFRDLLSITSNFTVQQMIERDMFQKRIEENKPIHLHEFLYPVAQAYDCVVMDVDLEIGGSDQLFNMMAGRQLMKAVKFKDKYVLGTKLLVDKDGNKAGKTTGNALFLDSSPRDFYGGIMTFPDEVIHLSYELLTEVSLEGLKEKIEADPMGKKKELAYEIVKMVWNEKEAKNAQEYFEKTFQQGKLPDLEISSSERILIDAVVKVVESRSEAKRLLQQKAIEVNGEVVTEPNFEFKGGEVVKIGKKKFVKINI
jgi:tyrosyl-tRNA synthetase